MCRGCCCGTAKHPEVDHDAHLARVQAAVAGRADTRMKVVDCLGPCSDSNVVLVRQRRRARPPAAVWLGGLLDDAAIGALSTWIATRGPRPAELERHVFLGPTAWDDLASL